LAMTRYESARDAAIAQTFDLTAALGRFPDAGQFRDLHIRFSRALDVEAQELAAREAPRGTPTRDLDAEVA
jgi:hypothetical protein